MQRLCTHNQTCKLQRKLEAHMVEKFLYQKAHTQIVEYLLDNRKWQALPQHLSLLCSFKFKVTQRECHT